MYHRRTLDLLRALAANGAEGEVKSSVCRALGGCEPSAFREVASEILDVADVCAGAGLTDLAMRLARAVAGQARGAGARWGRIDVFSEDLRARALRFQRFLDATPRSGEVDVATPRSVEADARSTDPQMPTLKVKDTTVELNEEGYLADLSQWNEDVACALAATEGVHELTKDHWKVANYLRQHYLEHGLAPMVRKLCKETGLTLKRIFELYPSGPAKGGCKVAGLPNGKGCI